MRMVVAVEVGLQRRIRNGGRVIVRADSAVLGGPSSIPRLDSIMAPMSGSMTMTPLRRSLNQAFLGTEVERFVSLTSDQSAQLDVLDALKIADVGDHVRRTAETFYQALIEAELTEAIGAALHVVPIP